MCGFCLAAILEDDCGEQGYGTVSADLGVYVAGDEFSGGEPISIQIYDGDANIATGNGDTGSLVAGQSFRDQGEGDYQIQPATYDADYAALGGAGVTSVQAIEGESPLDAIRGNKMLNDDDTILVYFAEAGDTYRSFLDVYTATGMTTYEEQQYFEIFEGIEEFADIDFEVTTDREAADLEVATAELPSGPGGTLLGFFNFPTSSGEGRFGVLNDEFSGYSDAPGGSLDTAGFMYGVAIHEFGHGLGLGHPHDTGNGSEVMLGVSGSDDAGAFGLNQAVYTSMSYVEGSHIAGVAPSDANNGHSATFGALDIAVLQEYYGANTTHASGNNTYTLHDNNDTGSAAGYYTMWDTSGTDKIEYVGTRDAAIDLRAATLEYEKGGGGFISYVDGVIGGLTIANGVVIENGYSDEGDDVINGNEAANVLDSGSGNDTLCGFGGDDTMRAGDGDDSARGFKGNDSVMGYDGNDLLRGDAGDDIVNGHKGEDTIRGGSGNDELLGGNGDDTIKGGADDDLIRAGGGADQVRGGGGNDTLDGGAGDDTSKGGAGNDTFVFSTGDDEVVDYDADSDLERIDLTNAVGITDYDALFSGRIEQINNDAVITDDNGDTMTFLNVDVGSLDEIEFIFALT